ncbi:hypothetical protein AOZ06_46190 [Kibdelosporangium phytohabitans]|uniref:DUF3558 domain-containing protein n=1 Tax=Kibdelosporangium phytohabitans TaxID=860235 RepID=A0A0N9ID96_9PSEU|nr:hypothetical protein AOZ06_46190 [Kibdelosporangium phytohabitans]
MLIAGFFVAGCTSAVGGEALPDPESAQAEQAGTSSTGLIGNATTLDPCSLVEPSSLSQFGPAQRPEQEAYDYCRLKLSVDGGVVAVRFGLLERVRGNLEAKEVEPVGRLRIFEENPAKDRCARYILFSDNVSLIASADTVDTPGKTVPQLCSITEKTTTTIAENLISRKVEHLTYPPSSLGSFDACNAVTVSLAQIPSLPAGEVISYPGRHQCRWGQAMVPSLTLRFVLGTPSTAPGVRYETIAGKQTGVYPVDIPGRTLCVAELKHGTGREMAQVVVRMAPTTPATACAAAQAVASEAWSKLPA